MRKIIKLLFVAFALAGLLNGCQAMTGETAGELVDDTVITTNVKAKLAAEKGATLTRIEVDTNRGVVQLSGTVSSASDRAMAERVARTVGGVKSVRNNLQVR